MFRFSLCGKGTDQKGKVTAVNLTYPVKLEEQYQV